MRCTVTALADLPSDVAISHAQNGEHHMNDHIPYGGYIQESEEEDLRRRAEALGNPIRYPIRNQYQYWCAIEQAVEPGIREQINALFDDVLREREEKQTQEGKLNILTRIRKRHLRLLKLTD